MTIADIFKVLDLHLNRADKAVEEISRIQLDKHAFDDFEVVKTIDTFIYRFSKIQDYMGEKLFPAVLDMLGEYKPSMSFKDIINKLERLEFIQSSRQWMDFREIRNTLTHEYPDNDNEIIEGIKLAVNAFTEIKNIYAGIKARF
ncbi:MAG: hypothetical protein HGJ94_21235 [Desulfosarcina sp.]|nr:hypothetical protein [Desulfosarcina sp.]